MRFPGFEGEWEYLNGDKAFKQISNKNHNLDLPILAITQEYGAIPRDKIDYNVIVSDKSIESYKIVEIGDFIISLRSFQGGIEYSNYKGLCSPAYIILRKTHTTWVDYFYKYYFKTEIFIRLLNKNIEGIRDGKMVSYKQFSEILLPIPKSEEQQKIADFLSSIDLRINTQMKIVEEIKSQIQGLIRSFLRKKEGNIQLKNCLNCHSSTLMESAVIEKSGIYPVYGATGIIAHAPDFEIDEDAVLIIKDGASVGKVQYAKDKYSVIGTLNYLTPKENVSLKYLYYYLQIFNFDKYKVGSGIPHIYFKDYANEYIYCPPIEKQNEIANLLSTIDEKLETEKQILKKYTEQKKYLLANMFI